MRKIWVKVDPWDKTMVTTALEGGADALMVPRGCSEKVKELGRIRTISEDGDLKPGKDVVTFTIKSGEDEAEIVALGRTKTVILRCGDWSVIPLENLIAKGADVVALVENFEDAGTAFGVLEKGVRRILMHTEDPLELKKVLSLLGSAEETIRLDEAEITGVKPVGMGDRVCVDACTAMTPGQGMLVGNSSQALFLVHAESIANPYVAPRPFRINAGPVHAYTRIPVNKTRDLSEFSSGDPVLIVDSKGNASAGVARRLKIEKRPLMLIEAMAQGRSISTILQNAETIRLTAPDGKALSAPALKPGDKVLAALEEGGRHFGLGIEERLQEK